MVSAEIGRQRKPQACISVYLGDSALNSDSAPNSHIKDGGRLK
jgi:hypothetical protein